ncbi:chromosome undetermined scaffold_50, whole genome shotgun sequence [Streptomyces azureus]|uniref:Chromosome undetermined scaffold_50, whole genome shotgun sequence n=1 Tax=Streptomyces azureus TaxID=146537 RepID=A0A0K8PQ74_STRAJ|nr:chromosome undetermined scaffold_50, whole genome shotgun sequence [Streptomyces azureus]
MTETSASLPGDRAGFPLLGHSPAKSVSKNNSPSSSRIRIPRLPFGKAARATRPVSSGTPSIFLTCNDTDTLPEHNVGLHDHNGS